MSQTYNINYKNDRELENLSTGFSVYGIRRAFEIALLISLAIHLLVLCAVFIDEKLNNEPEFKVLSIQLQEEGSDSETFANLLERAQQASAPKQMLIEKSIAEDENNAENKLKANSQINETIALPDTSKEAAKNTQSPTLGNSLLEQQAQQQQISAKPTPSAKPQNKTAEAKKPLGNSKAKDAEALIRYEQLLPLWLNRFRSYPPLARQLGLEGKGVVYLRINREGKVLYASISRSTGHQILDDALLAMVAAANPVLPVPADYSVDYNEFSYQIEFNFQLGEN